MPACLRVAAGAVMMVSAIFAGQAVAQSTPVPRLDAAATQRALDEGAVVIDVRRPEEWRSTGVLPGSLLITAYDQGGQLVPGFLEAVRARTNVGDRVVLICRSGTRSEKAAQLLMTQAGYRDVSNADGGIVAWVGAGRPVTPCPSC